MNQKKLIENIAIQTDLPPATVEKFIKRYAASVILALQQGEDVTLPYIGKLKLADSAAREGRSPATGETIHIPAKKRVVFKAAKGLKEAVN